MPVTLRFSGILIVILTAISLAGCDERMGEYVAASAISDSGFARVPITPIADGDEIQVWGFVDYGNIYANGDAREILGNLWSGEGPDPRTWRFNLKAHNNDPIGQSFAVLVPEDNARNTVLKTFAMNARARKPTRVFLRGRMFTFEAPTNSGRRTGLRLELESGRDIGFGPGHGKVRP